jgi:hypothetical protein
MGISNIPIHFQISKKLLRGSIKRINKDLYGLNMDLLISNNLLICFEIIIQIDSQSFNLNHSINFLKNFENKKIIKVAPNRLGSNYFRSGP